MRDPGLVQLEVLLYAVWHMYVSVQSLENGCSWLNRQMSVFLSICFKYMSQIKNVPVGFVAITQTIPDQLPVANLEDFYLFTAFSLSLPLEDQDNRMFQLFS